ncbi:MAG: hypothetical protein GPJ17_07070 [Microcystis aeruginosa K13-07]|jgi:riboflavin synthase alpha subunit|nr:hypothetical protein [Microcystis aeruginosa K13-07]
MAALTKEQIINDRDRTQKEIFRLQNEKTIKLEQREITVRDFNEITATQYEIQNKINALNVLLINKTFDSITVGDDSPGAILSASIDQLKKAVDKLDEVRDFLNAAAKLINGLSAIIGVLVSLSGSIR